MIHRESQLGSCRAGAFFLLAAVLLVGGTACSKQEPLHPVTGKVIFRNQPLPDAKVTFVPYGEGKAGADMPIGTSGPDGTFTLKTGENEGAAAGSYKVTIQALATPKATPQGMAMGDPEPVDRLGGLYANPEKTTITAQVKEGTNELEPFQLK